MLCIEKNDTLTFMLNEQLGCFQAAAAINEIENAKINILPNPANDYITLTFNNINDVSGEIIIIDIIGNVVYRKTIHDNSTRFNVASFSQGVYTVVFTNKKGKSISKFIKIN
jgi:predicted nicotinamide N-methyase